MNAKVHDTIGVSQAELLYGKAINLYTGLLSPFPPESLVKGQEEAVNGRLSDHIAKLIAMQTQALMDYCLSNRLVSLIPISLRGQQSKSLTNDIQSSIRG